MAKPNTIPTRIDPALKKFLSDISLERFRNSKDKVLLKPARIGLAITRVPNLKKILMEAKIDDK